MKDPRPGRLSAQYDADNFNAWQQQKITDETNVRPSSSPASRTQCAGQALATEAVPPKQGTLAVNVAIGNHRYPHGIGEILYTLKAFFSRLSSSYEVTYSIDLKPGVTNVLIDEFSLVKTIAFLQEFKRDHPGTKFVIVGTEFITPIRLFGRQIGETFNYFDPWEDRKYGFEMIGHRLGLARVPPYMLARYLGFCEALRFADLVIAVHPAITETLLPLTARMDHWVASPVTLYPEINAEKNVLNVRLQEWPVGFVTTGTQTRFRREIIRKLLLAATNSGVQGPVFAHLPFEQTAPFALHDGAIEFPFETLGSQISEEKRLDIVGPERGGLFNLNPPQRANWQYSSPMRILRAVLYGQIPVITRRFGDHEIEALATLWNPDAADAAVIRELWLEATLKRESLIERHIAAISEYNEIAKQKNTAVDLALRAL